MLGGDKISWSLGLASQNTVHSRLVIFLLGSPTTHTHFLSFFNGKRRGGEFARLGQYRYIDFMGLEENILKSIQQLILKIRKSRTGWNIC